MKVLPELANFISAMLRSQQKNEAQYEIIMFTFSVASVIMVPLWSLTAGII